MQEAKVVFNLLNELEAFNRLMDVGDVAKILKKSKCAVYRMAQKGQLPSILVGGSRRFDPSTLAAHFRKKSPQLASAARLAFSN